MRQFLDYKSIDCRSRTVVRISDALKSFSRYAETVNLSRVGQIRTKHIMDWQLWRLKHTLARHKTTPPSIVTVNQELSGIRAWCGWLTLRGDLEVNPCTGIKKLRVGETSERKALSRAEWLRFERCSLELELRPKSRGMGLKYNSRRGQTRVFRFLEFSGLRIQELTHLEFSDLEPDGIKVQKKKDWNPKTYQRLVPWNESTRRVIAEIIRERSGVVGLVFVDYRQRRLKPARVRDWILAVAKMAGIEGMTGPHTFRHTCLSWLANDASIPPSHVQAIAGHARLETTQLYIHHSRYDVQRSMEKLSVG